MRHSDRQRVFVDLEYIHPNMTVEYGRPTDKDLRQIIQIGAIIVDTESGNELDSFDILVKPLFTKKLPPFFTELTTITQKQMDQDSIELNKALSLFEQFTNKKPIWTFDQDESVFQQNYKYINRTFTFEDRPFIRVKPQLSKWNIDPNQYSSGTLYKAVGLTMNGHVHNALHDVRSMSAAIHALEQKEKIR